MECQELKLAVCEQDDSAEHRCCAQGDEEEVVTASVWSHWAILSLSSLFLRFVVGDGQQGQS